MKRTLITLAVCALFILVLSSCSGSKKCPAYTQNNTTVTTETARS